VRSTEFTVSDGGRETGAGNGCEGRDDELVENDLPSPSSNLFPMMDHSLLSEAHSSSRPSAAREEERPSDKDRQTASLFASFQNVIFPSCAALLVKDERKLGVAFSP
jgi:hypothetical protein